MIWHEFIVYVASEAEDAVSNVLNENGANGVVIEDLKAILKRQKVTLKEIFDVPVEHLPKDGIRIKAYFPEKETWSEKFAFLKEEIKALRQFDIHLGELSFDESNVAESDWENEWKKYFDVQKITSQLVVVPEWLDYRVKDNEKLIHIDPGMAFGTGTHPTTILSVQALEKHIKAHNLVLDVGVGSGILSIAAILQGASHVYSYDIDGVAVKSAKMNVDLNNMSQNITVEEADLLKSNNKKADIIVSNILAEILVDLVKDAEYFLQPNGYFIMSGIIEAKKDLVLDKLKQYDFEVIEINQIDHWVAIVAKKKAD